MDTRLLLLVREALDLPEGDRDAFVTSACPEELRAQVRAMLDQVGSESDTMTPPTQQGLDRPLDLGDWRGRRIGAFQLVEPLGQGGMGVVWRAVRLDGFAQDVAIKWLHAGMSAAARQRFARERELLARLEHPNIARIVDGGEDGDTPWYAMEYVDGDRLGDHVARVRMSLEQRLLLFLQIVDAVDYAHQRFIVHRDLKPSNVMVRRDGQAKLLDFGIARLLDGSDPLTGTNAPMTLAYAAPEQIRGEPATAATDVHALGVILFEMLTGRRPHEAASAPELMHRITHDEVTQPSRVATQAEASAIDGRLLRGDLDTIVLKALHREPGRRYPTASAFAEDLRRALRHEPILARGDARLYRAAKFVRRHRVASLVVGLLAIGLVAATVLAVVQRGSALEAAALAERNAATARASTQFLLDMLGSTNPWEGGANITVRDLAKLAVARVPEALPDQPEARIEIYRSLRDTLSVSYPTRDALVPAEAVVRELAARQPVDAEALAQAEYELLRIQMHQMQRLDLAEPTLRALEARAPGLSPKRQLEIRRNRAYFEQYLGRTREADRIWESLRNGQLGSDYRFDPDDRAFNLAQDPSVVFGLAETRRSAGDVAGMHQLLRLGTWIVHETPPDDVRHWSLVTGLVYAVASLKPDAEGRALLERLRQHARDQFGAGSMSTDYVDSMALPLLVYMGRYAEADALAATAEAAMRQRQDESRISLGRMLFVRAHIAKLLGDRDAMRRYLDEATPMLDPLGRADPDNQFLIWSQYLRQWLAMDPARPETIQLLAAAADDQRMKSMASDVWFEAQFDVAEAWLGAGDRARARAVIERADALPGMAITMPSVRSARLRAAVGLPEPDRSMLELPTLMATVDDMLDQYAARVAAQRKVVPE